MTRPKPPAELQRLNRRVGEILRAVLGCPLCRIEPASMSGGECLRVVSYRQRTVRLECVACGLRFTMSVKDVLHTVYERGGFTAALADVVWRKDDLDYVRQAERDHKSDRRHVSSRTPAPVEKGGQ